MSEHKHHEQLIKEISEQLKPILEGSGQAIYIYLDDIHKFCNKRFALLLGYESPSKWAKVEESFPDAFVAPKSQRNLVTAYQNAMEEMISSTIKITWKKKTGGTVDTTVILVPLAYNGHIFALHFIAE